MPHATLMSFSFSCGCLFYRASRSPHQGHPDTHGAAMRDFRTFLNDRDHVPNGFAAQVAGPEERARIVDAICARGGEMIMHPNWAVQRCLEAATGPEERRKIVACIRGRIVDLATNCYEYHVLQNCKEEEVCMLIVSELLRGVSATTLVNLSHVWSKHGFKNLEESTKHGIVDELFGQGVAVFSEVAKSQWGSYCIQHILEHRSKKYRQLVLEHLLTITTSQQGSKSVVKPFEEGRKETLDHVVERMCEPARRARRVMIVDLALSLTGSQLITSILPMADKDQRAALYDCIRGHIVTLRGRMTNSKVIWLFDRMRAYYGY
ncbi:armadillo-type protein [Mycena metata]|uniref:Armadillo-type protein n=1 Tax=Mycena metata TaxID=1033252 RepID=A0AAD7H7G6_9AGAR|nr:armadillo-type protein [Mycena metata]